MKLLAKIAPISIAFLCGILVGQIRFSSSDLQRQAATVASEKPKGKQVTAEPNSVRNKPRIDPHFADKYSRADYAEQKKLLDAIPLDQQMAYLEEVLLLSGPKGLKTELQYALSNILQRQMARNPQGTVDWVLANKHVGNRDYLFEQILEEEKNKKWVQQNFDELLTKVKALESPHESLKDLIETMDQQQAKRAVELSKQLLKNHDGKIDYPHGLQQEAINQGWETAFEFFKDCWLPSNGSSSSSWNRALPKGFDYQAFANAWSLHEAGLKLENEWRFYLPPSPIWKYWSQADPQAALDYLQSGASKTFGVDDFFEGYEQVASPGDYFAMARGMVEHDNSRRNEVFSLLSSYLDDGTANLAAFVESVKASGDTTFVPELIQSSRFGDRQQAIASLLQALKPEQRLQTLREVFTRKTHDGKVVRNNNPARQQSVTQSLIQLGHSPAELDAFFRSLPK
jgi:hypothetical protein